MRPTFWKMTRTGRFWITWRSFWAGLPPRRATRSLRMPPMRWRRPESAVHRATSWPCWRISMRWCATGCRAARRYEGDGASEFAQSGLARRHKGRGEVAQPMPLQAVCIEIGGVEPCVIGRAQRGPVAVDHREPRGIAIAPFHDCGLTKDTLEHETEAPGSAARRGIERVAFPLEAAIARIERPMHHQVYGVGRDTGALQCGGHGDEPHLDRACAGIDPQKGRNPGCRAARAIPDRIEQGVITGGSARQPRAKIRERGKRTDRHVIPDRIMALERVEKLCGMGLGQPFQKGMAALDARGSGTGRRLPSRNGWTDGAICHLLSFHGDGTAQAKRVRG